ncbi:outer membrane protein assembly factor BamB family protein [Actinoplanes italicus]|uniref:Outer membrane protein assembly factor BamB n=1 Tax=Actinoplanes italicus TaxID=113567 RepID=A0A2T0KFI5_9ACTN|nr:PQQ-binding-like beta-propeller repeat protein [Actinoplanes italicus]PRX22137.1 outer membrane protein assembly factor BamB [Actinoplanes italicus]
MIDLGDLSAPEYPRPDRRPRHRYRWRDLGLAFAAALCLVSLHSVPDAGPTLRLLWASPFDRTLIAQAGSGTVYVHRAVGFGGELIAHDLATGKIRWTIPTTPDAVTAGWLVVHPEPGLVLLPTATGAVVLDATTGATLWQLTGSVEGRTAQTLLIRDGGDGRASTLRLVGARDGRTIWQRPIGEVRTMRVRTDDERPAVIALDDGDLTLFRYDDGEILGRSDLPESGIDSPQLSFSGDRLLVTGFFDSRVTVTAHLLDDLAESWRTEIRGWGAVDDCGPVVCVATPAGVSGREPGTGTERWFVPGAQGMSPISDDRLVMFGSSSAADGLPAISVLDATTGRRLGDEVSGMPSSSITGEGRLIVLHPQGPPIDPTSVYDLDVVTGRRTLLGQVGYEIVNEPYELAGHYLIRQRQGRVQVMSVG